MKVGVLGAGNMGRIVVEHLTGCPGVDGLVAYDISQERCRRLGERDNVAWTTCLGDVLSDPEVRLVFVTSSNDAHKTLTVQALEAHKAVMCEKPMATTLADSRAMVEAAERHGGFLQVGFELRYSRLFAEVKERIDAGLLGDVINTHCFLVIAAWEKSGWRCQEGVTGSMFSEKLSHYVDLPRWWVGSEVKDVYSACAPNIIPYYEVHDNYHTTYRFENGAVSHVTLLAGLAGYDFGHNTPPGDRTDELVKLGYVLRYVIGGTKGAVKVDAHARSLERWEYGDSPAFSTSTLIESLTWDAKDDFSYYHNTLDQARDIVRRVAEGSPPRISPRDAYGTMKLCFAAEASADRGEVVGVTDFDEA